MPPISVLPTKLWSVLGMFEWALCRLIRSQSMIESDLDCSVRCWHVANQRLYKIRSNTEPGWYRLYMELSRLRRLAYKDAWALTKLIENLCGTLNLCFGVANRWHAYIGATSLSKQGMGLCFEHVWATYIKKFLRYMSILVKHSMLSIGHAWLTPVIFFRTWRDGFEFVLLAT